MGLQPILRTSLRPWRVRVLRNLIGMAGSIAVVCALYYLLRAINATLGDVAPWATAAVVLALYLVSFMLVFEGRGGQGWYAAPRARLRWLAITPRG